MKFLLRGVAGHPLHPPLTDVAIGAYTVSAAMAVVSRLGISEHNTATAWWLALIVGLIATAPAAITGFVDWLDITSGTPLWRTATAHLAVMLAATVIFAITAGAGHADYVDRSISGGALILTLVGYGLLSVGGWLGGSVVFVHGMRVLNLVDEPALRAAAPVATPEKREAEGA